MSQKKSIWAPPGWAWELELLTLLFFILALAAPFYLHYNAPPKSTENLTLVQMAQLQNKNPVHVSMEEQRGIFWALIVAGIYVAHLVIGHISLQIVSTPAASIFFPALFATIAYLRTSTTANYLEMDLPLLDGSWPHALAAFGLVLSAGLLIARVRMRRQLLRFRQVQWGITTKNVIDGSMLTEVISAFRPLIYPPQRYQACEDGILVVGYFYIMPIPFKTIHSIVRAKKGNLLTSSYTLATSAHHLARIQLTEQSEPIFISPLNTDEFVRYCEPFTHTASNRTAGDTRGAGRTSPGDTSASPAPRSAG